MRISDWSSDVCSSDLARTVRNTRLDLDEILWRLGFLDTLDRPHYVALLENILANENLRKAYVACWKADKDAFGCAMKEPAEYSRLVGNRHDTRKALETAVRDAVDEEIGRAHV